MNLKMLSYNIHKGFSFDNRFVLDAIRQAIQTSGAELVFLQEVQGAHTGKAKKVKDWPAASQLEFLADSIWPHFAYGKNAVYTEGHHGNAILSKHPFKMFENIDISNNRFERRGMLHATIDIGEKKQELHVICLHLDLFEKGRANQYARLVKRIHEHVPDDQPLIIAGDFNDWRENASQHLVDELGVEEVFSKLHGKHALSFPSWFPFLPLDRIYTRGLKPVEAKCFVESPWDKLSDHGALFSVVERV
ncbi:MAG: EEP domain-containing protein [Proteobacteria bacterium]|nr:MAG: EEP domain-containing protein [Pseudomonadota bacterium]